jgi:DNA-binding transcriptional ArsR family regulator
MTVAINLAEVASLVGDPARANILSALMDGRALTATELSHAAGVTPQTTSGHLAKLTDARLLSVLHQGRHRYYRLGGPLVAQMLEGIMAVAIDGPPRYRPASRADDAMKAARICYNHLAGRLGVGIADALSGRGHVVFAEEGGEVTPGGLAFMQDFGIDLAAARRRGRVFCRACLDWTERRPHVGGALGSALATRCFDLDWLARTRGSRALTITSAGRKGFAETFGVSL